MYGVRLQRRLLHRVWGITVQDWERAVALQQEKRVGQTCDAHLYELGYIHEAHFRSLGYTSLQSLDFLGYTLSTGLASK